MSTTNLALNVAKVLAGLLIALSCAGSFTACRGGGVGVDPHSLPPDYSTHHPHTATSTPGPRPTVTPTPEPCVPL